MLAIEHVSAGAPDASALHERVRDACDAGARSVVIDFSGLQWFGSAVLGALAASLATVQAGGGDLCVTGLSPKVESIMEVTRLLTVFRRADSVDEAIVLLEGAG